MNFNDTISHSDDTILKCGSQTDKKSDEMDWWRNKQWDKDRLHVLNKLYLFRNSETVCKGPTTSYIGGFIDCQTANSHLL